MEEQETENIYAIPANYTDSGRILGGMLAPRNAIEALLLAGVIGYLEFKLLSAWATVRIVVMTVTLIPLAFVTLMGFDGDSLFQRIGHVAKYMIRRRKLHFKRIGEGYEKKQT